MKIVGLTGSIGMGKSTAAAMFMRLGVPVHDADATVHALLETGGDAVSAISTAFPDVFDSERNAIDRKKLGAIVFRDVKKKAILEGFLHPLVRKSQDDFIRTHRALGAKNVVLDIPLLYETGADARVDKVVVVTAPAQIQEQRVMARPGMTRDRFDAILLSQTSNAEKCRRADFVVQTGLGYAHTMRELKKIIRNLSE